MRPSRLETIKKIIRVDRREICLLKFILEAYDGIATMTTLDARQGIAMLRIAPGCEKEVADVIRDLGRDILIDTLDGCPSTVIDECN